jgi:hypothetical protein
MAEMLPVSPHGCVGVEDRDSTVSRPGLLEPWNLFWELSSVVVGGKFLALVLAMQAAGHANRLKYRRPMAVGIDEATAMVGTLGISGRSMVI